MSSLAAPRPEEEPSGPAPSTAGRPAYLAQGSVDAPPAGTRRKRAPTVEFPTVAADLSEPPTVDFPIIDSGLGEPEPPAVDDPAIRAPTILRQSPSVRAGRPRAHAPATPTGRARRSASFSEADAAFFAAGDQMERAGHHSVKEEDLDHRATAKRPSLWQRIARRLRSR